MSRRSSCLFLVKKRLRFASNMTSRQSKYNLFSRFTKRINNALCRPIKHIHNHDIIPTNTDRQFENCIHLIRKLGRGGFGSVYLARWKSKDFALKILHRKPEDLVIKCLEAERLLLDLQHPNIVKTLLVQSPWTGFKNGLILMEYAGDRNLQYIIDDPNEHLCYYQRVKFGLHISKAMEYLHSMNVIHMDLKPNNIIVTNYNTCKICDFGCCQFLNWPIMEQSSLSGTAAYIAPEVLKGAVLTEKCDVYSFGIVLWQMLWREDPFESMEAHAIIYRVVTDNLRPKENDSLVSLKDLAYASLYKQCWNAEPHNRPNFNELAELLNDW